MLENLNTMLLPFSSIVDCSIMNGMKMKKRSLSSSKKLKKQKNKKHKKCRSRSSHSDSSEVEIKWVEAVDSNEDPPKLKKHKNNKKHKKEGRSRSSHSESSEVEMEWVEAVDSKEDPPKPKAKESTEVKDIQKTINQHQKMKAAVDKCEYCMDQPKMKRHLLVTIQDQVYLSVPVFESLTKGHSLIVPKRHVPSFLHLDKDEWDEVEELKSLLRNVFRKQKKAVLFLETSYNFKWCPHAFLECIPVPEEEGDMAPFYFKKAIQESEEEWAHNIKLVDLSKKGLRKSIPKNLPYFCVLFDPAIHSGYAHVIENEQSFPRNFGKEVIGGMMDIDYNHLYKNRKADALKKSNEALQLIRVLSGLI